MVIVSGGGHFDPQCVLLLNTCYVTLRLLSGGFGADGQYVFCTKSARYDDVFIEEGFSAPPCDARTSCPSHTAYIRQSRTISSGFI